MDGERLRETDGERGGIEREKERGKLKKREKEEGREGGVEKEG